MAKKDEQPTHLKHLQDHAPTVIHHPEEDETILARWLRRGLEKGARFWLLIAGVVIAVFVVSMLIRGITGGRSAQAEAWEELILAAGTEDPVAQELAIGERGVGDAAAWALLRAAESRYRDGFSDLPQNRDAALERLSEAHDLFQRTYERSADDPLRRRLAAMGMARSLEARGDLDGAVQQYKAIVKEFPGTAEAERAQELADALQEPETIAFYQQFSSFKPEEAVLPPGGTGTFNLPDLPGFPTGTDADSAIPAMPNLGGVPSTPVVPGTGPIPGLPETPAPTVPAPAPTPPASAPAEPASTVPADSAPAEPSPAPPAEPTLPGDLFAPDATPEGPARDEAPAAGELPVDPFSQP